MRILFAPMAGAFGLGAITRCLAVAQEAELRGHDVAMLTPSEYPLVDAFFRGPRLTVPRPVPAKHRGVGESPDFADMLILRGMDDASYIAAAVSAEIEAIKAYQPDLVFTENQPTIALSASVCGVPFVPTVQTINLEAESPETQRVSEEIARTYSQVAASLGQPERPTLQSFMIDAAPLAVAPSIEILEPRVAERPNVFFSGPLLFAPIELGSVPHLGEGEKGILVYLSRGLVAIDDVMAPATEAFPTDKILVAATDERATRRTVPFSFRNAFCTRLPPLTSALKCSRLLITRGGQNTAMAALLAGCPMIGLPGTVATEARFNLVTLEQLGVARVIDGLPSAQALRDAAGDLAASGAPRRAVELGHQLRSKLGVSGLVQRLETLVATAGS
jgi:UDP:flavonoid glycosyltransferase YjiC (YdhE family)